MRLLEVPDDVGSERRQHGIEPAVGQPIIAVLPEEVEARVCTGNPAPLPFTEFHATDLEVGPILGARRGVSSDRVRELQNFRQVLDDDGLASKSSANSFTALDW